MPKGTTTRTSSRPCHVSAFIAELLVQCVRDGRGESSASPVWWKAKHLPAPGDATLDQSQRAVSRWPLPERLGEADAGGALPSPGMRKGPHRER